MSGMHGKVVSYLPSSLIDYPGHLAAVGFTYGCNLTCRFCHNKELLSGIGTEKVTPKDKTKEFLKFIKDKRIEYVVITGGEPLLHPGRLKDLILAIKNISINIKIKLDTNGSFFIGLLENSRYPLQKFKGQYSILDLVDYVAMDIKAFNHGEYRATQLHGRNRAESDKYYANQFTNMAEIIRGTYNRFKVQFEFRHTLSVMPTLGEIQNFCSHIPIQTSIPLYIQKMNVENILDTNLLPCAPTEDALKFMRTVLNPKFTNVKFRGFDF